MITTITNDNRDLYNSLFEKANKLLDKIFEIKEHDDNIENIDNVLDDNQNYYIFIDNINYTVPKAEYDLITDENNGIKSTDYDEEDISGSDGFEINSLSDYFNVIAN